MFYAFNWLNRVQIFSAFRTTLLKWVQQQTVAVYLEGEEFSHATSLEVRRLKQSEREQLQFLLDDIWGNVAYAGCNVGTSLSDVNGYCHFSLDKDDTEARLVSLITTPEIGAISPLQSPVLLLALVELYFDKPDLQYIYLPFPQTSPEELDTLALLSLYRTDEPGKWRKKATFQTKAKAESGREVERWLEVALEVDPGITKIINRIFTRYGHQGNVLAQTTKRSLPNGYYVDDEFAPLKLLTYLPLDEVDSTLVQLQEALANIAKAHPLPELELTERSLQEWINIWVGFEICRVGKHVVIKLPGKTYTPAPDDLVVEIKSTPSVFSTFTYGVHPTSSLSLQLIEKFIDPTRHQKMLDVGTGSGMLAILGAKMGVQEILAVDAYPVAVADAQSNVTQNGFSDRIRVEAGSLAVIPMEGETVYVFEDAQLKPPPILAKMQPFDVIVANLYAWILVGLAPAFVENLKPGGLLLVSGIAERSSTEVEEALQAVGLELLEKMVENTWVGLAYKKQG